jgi:transcriptional regulator with XRE-family HTH domain
MAYDTNDVAHRLKAARKAKGWSQRALGDKVGVPQSHISNIEKGSVDLRLSSLLALARILDLELTLVPRKAVPAVQTIVRASEADPARSNPETNKEIARWRETLGRYLYGETHTTELAQLKRRISELQRFSLPPSELQRLKDIRNSLHSALKNKEQETKAFRQALTEVQTLRNILAHDAESPSLTPSIRPAYSLDDEEGGDG